MDKTIIFTVILIILAGVFFWVFQTFQEGPIGPYFWICQRSIQDVQNRVYEQPL